MLSNEHTRKIKLLKMKMFLIIPSVYHEVEKIPSLQIRLWRPICENRKRQGESAKGKFDSDEEGNFLLNGFMSWLRKRVMSQSPQCMFSIHIFFKFWMTKPEWKPGTQTHTYLRSL